MVGVTDKMVCKKNCKCNEEKATSKTLKKPKRQDLDMAKEKYIYAFDPSIKKRVVFVVRNGVAVSLVTGRRFRYRPRR